MFYQESSPAAETEARFGLCCQLSGGNYLISREKVINGKRFEHTNLYSKLRGVFRAQSNI